MWPDQPVGEPLGPGDGGSLGEGVGAGLDGCGLDGAGLDG